MKQQSGILAAGVLLLLVIAPGMAQKGETMTTNYHTPIAVGADADAATFNAPYSDLDSQITAHNTEIVAARGGLGSIDARLDVSLTNTGAIAAAAVSAQSMINLGDAAAINGDAVRYQEFTVAHAAGGAHAANAITAQSQVNLADASAANGDVVRHNEFIIEHWAESGEHVYPAGVIYFDSTVGGASGVAAAALPVYTYTNGGASADEAKVRFSFYHRKGSATAVYMDCLAMIDADPGTDIGRVYLTITDGTNTATGTNNVNSYGVYDQFQPSAALASLDDGICEVEFGLRWVNNEAGGHTISMKLPVARFYNAGP